MAPALLARIESAAEAAFPEECCGLLLGLSGAAGALRVEAVEASRNVTGGDPRRSFEVDPQLRFDVMRRLAEGPRRIVGHYHSHPGAAAEPSPRDRARAWEPDMVWMITAVASGRAGATRAFVIDGAAGKFREITIDTGAAAAGAASGGATR